MDKYRRLLVARADGEALPASGAARLYLPAGANGSTFLITDNFEVILILEYFAETRIS